MTVLSPEKDESITNLHYIHMDQVYESIYNSSDSEEINYVEMGDKNPYDMIAEYAKFSTEMCVGQVKSNGWKQLENYPNDFKVINDRNEHNRTITTIYIGSQFDLIIYDYLMGGCLIAFANKFENVPIIGMTAFNDNFRVNSFSGHAVVPSISSYAFYNHNPTTFFGRTFNFLLHMADKISIHCYAIPKMTKIIRESTSFKNTPSMLELGTKSVLYMTNYDPSVDGIQQIPPNVIAVGGLQIKPPTKLPEVCNFPLSFRNGN